MEDHRAGAGHLYTGDFFSRPYMLPKLDHLQLPQNVCSSVMEAADNFLQQNLLLYSDPVRSLRHAEAVLF